VRLPEVRDQIAEAVDVDDLPNRGPGHLVWLRQRERGEVDHADPEVMERGPVGEMSGGRRKDIASVKRGAEWEYPVFLFGELVGLPFSRGCDAPHLERPALKAGVCVGDDVGEQAVVGARELPWLVRTAIGRRRVPTPGSMTATRMASAGK